MDISCPVFAEDGTEKMDIHGSLSADTHKPPEHEPEEHPPHESDTEHVISHQPQAVLPYHCQFQLTALAVWHGPGELHPEL